MPIFRLINQSQTQYYFLKSVNYLLENLTPRYEKINHTIKTGDNLQTIFKDHNVPYKEIKLVINNIPKKSKIKNLKVGYKIIFSIILLIDIFDESLKKSLTELLSFNTSETFKQSFKVLILYAILTLIIFIILKLVTCL